MTLVRVLMAMPLVFAIVFADKSCDIDLGNIGDYVVTYDITVTNRGAEPAVIGISGSDVHAQGIVQPGEALSATSFQGGSFTAWAGPSTDIKATLNAAKADVEAKLAQTPIAPSTAVILNGELQAINAQLKAEASKSHIGACFFLLKPDEKGKGQDVDILEAQQVAGGWTVNGFCAT